MVWRSLTMAFHFHIRRSNFWIDEKCRLLVLVGELHVHIPLAAVGTAVTEYLPSLVGDSAPASWLLLFTGPSI